MKFNPVDHRLYAMTRESDVGGCNSCLVSIDTTTAASTTIVDVFVPDSGWDGPYPSMAFLSDGSLYAWTEVEDMLTRIDTTSGVATTLGGSIGSSGHGMCATAEDQILWINGDGSTYRIDPADGGASYIGSVGTSLRGDCDPATLAYWGVNTTSGSAPTTTYQAALSTTSVDSSSIVWSGTSAIESFHGIAFYR